MNGYLTFDMYVYIFEGLWRTVLLARFFTETVRNQGELRRVTMHMQPDRKNYDMNFLTLFEYTIY